MVGEDAPQTRPLLRLAAPRPHRSNLSQGRAHLGQNREAGWGDGLNGSLQHARAHVLHVKINRARRVERLAQSPRTAAICRSLSAASSSMIPGPGTGREKQSRKMKEKAERENDGSHDGSVSSITRHRRAWRRACRARRASRRLMYCSQESRTAGAPAVTAAAAIWTL